MDKKGSLCPICFRDFCYDHRKSPCCHSARYCDTCRAVALCDKCPSRKVPRCCKQAVKCQAAGCGRVSANGQVLFLRLRRLRASQGFQPVLRARRGNTRDPQDATAVSPLPDVRPPVLSLPPGRVPRVSTLCGRQRPRRAGRGSGPGWFDWRLRRPRRCKEAIKSLASSKYVYSTGRSPLFSTRDLMSAAGGIRRCILCLCRSVLPRHAQ